MRREVEPARRGNAFLCLVVAVCIALTAVSMATVELAEMEPRSLKDAPVGHTQFRNLNIQNGRGSDIATFTGSTGDMHVTGNLHVHGIITSDGVSASSEASTSLSAQGSPTLTMSGAPSR